VTNACVLTFGAVSSLGLAEQACEAGVVGEKARIAIARDETLAHAGLHRPFCARAVPTPDASRFEDRATALLFEAFKQLGKSLDEVRPGWRDERLGLAVGTSSGGMLCAETFFRLRELRGRGSVVHDEEAAEIARKATYFAPLDDALAAFGLSERSVCRKAHLVAACAASTLAMGLGLRWLDRDACDLVIAGGYDAASVFVAMGFEALRATSASQSRPFRVGRDGMSLGEGAGLIAFVREENRRGVAPKFYLAGFGASTDAVHITAPDRTGSGLARAGRHALEDSGLSFKDVGLVSAHGTATPFNDAMESRAIATLFPEEPAPIVHPYKAQIGHTLGAAGILESLAVADAITRGVAPAAAGEGEIDPDASVKLLERSEARQIDAGLKLSAAFGGANAAVVISRRVTPRKTRQLRPVYLQAMAQISPEDLAGLSEMIGVPRDRLARLDSICKLGLRAVAELGKIVGVETIRGAGIVAGHGLATIDTNDRFDSKRRVKGATYVDPRLFPATSPNAVAGECAIVFGLTGPSFAVNAGFDGGTEALASAAEFVAAGDCDQMVIVAADDAGPSARELLEWSGQTHRLLAEGAVSALIMAAKVANSPQIDLNITPSQAQGPIGHLALADRLKQLLLTD
jgi:3-oxoacyl-[acyl-carrier-protein] synthase II